MIFSRERGTFLRNGTEYDVSGYDSSFPYLEDVPAESAGSVLGSVLALVQVGTLYLLCFSETCFRPILTVILQSNSGAISNIVLALCFSLGSPDDICVGLCTQKKRQNSFFESTWQVFLPVFVP